MDSLQGHADRPFDAHLLHTSWSSLRELSIVVMVSYSFLMTAENQETPGGEVFCVADRARLCVKTSLWLSFYFRKVATVSFIL
jgi:hypothetical protein